MGLFDAMNASVTGMQAQSNYLTNIGQNISNSSTVGYKEADTEFSTLVDQAAVGQTAAGGVITSTQLNIAQQGTLESTSSPTDLAISGNGFFVVSNSAGQEFLTRAGSFVPDANGNLVNAAGYYLMGYSLANGTPTMASNSLSGMQVVNVNSSTLSASPTTSGTLTANLPSTNSIISSADLPSANSSTSTYDEKTSVVMYNDLGGSENVDLYFAQTSSGTWQVSAFDHSAASSSGGFPYSSGPLATTTLSFSSSSGYLASSSANSLSIPVPGGSTMTLDLSGMTQLAGNFAVSTSQVNGSSAASVNWREDSDLAGAFDDVLAISSLPRACGARLETIPAPTPYLFAEGERVEFFRTRLESEGVKIGLCWRGNVDFRVDPRRSIPPESFLPLAGLENARLINLQKGARAEELPDALAARLENLSENFDSGPDAFIDAAAIVANLDLVVTCDTSMAHLAGALGRPVWVALRHISEWRWMAGREDSPWYPSMRLFRCREGDDWTALLSDMAGQIGRR